jgi:hypothetical protein
MRRRGDRGAFSMLALFHDPMLTTVGLILFATIWMVIPGQVKPSVDAQAKVWQQSDSLKKKAMALSDSAHALETALHGIRDRIPRDIGLEIRRAREMTGTMEADIQRIREALSHVSVKRESADTTKIRMDREKELELRQKEFSEAQHRLELARSYRALSQDLRQRQDSLAKLTARVGAHPPTSAPSGENLFSYIGPTTKKPTRVELAGDLLFPLDETHHEVAGAYLTGQGDTVIEIVRRESRGKPVSYINTVLDKLNTKEDYIDFLLHGDSFSAYRDAKEIAFGRGFEVAWHAITSDTIRMRIGSKRTGLGGTEHPPER